MKKKVLAGFVTDAMPLSPLARGQRETQPPTRAEALASLWRVKLWLGQYPIRIPLAEAEKNSQI